MPGEGLCSDRGRAADSYPGPPDHRLPRPPRGPADCVAAGVSASADPPGDAVAVWLGLHGLAHQRTVTHRLPAPPDIEDRIVTALAHLTG